jgi:hypothetical protein
MIISGIAGFIASAVTAELYSSYTENDLLSSLATVLTGIAISNLSFVILFHIENRSMYVDSSNGKINYKILRQIFKKLGVAWSIFEMVNNVSRFIILYHLFSMDLDPSDASMLSSLVVSGISFLSINLVLKRFRIFQIGNTSSDFSFKDQASDPQR